MAGKLEIGMEEWLRGLEQAGVPVPGASDAKVLCDAVLGGADDLGLTAAEISKATGMAPRTVRTRIAAMVQAGQFVKGRARRRDSLGHMQRVAVYRAAALVEGEGNE